MDALVPGMAGVSSAILAAGAWTQHDWLRLAAAVAVMVAAVALLYWMARDG